MKSIRHIINFKYVTKVICSLSFSARMSTEGIEHLAGIRNASLASTARLRHQRMKYFQVKVQERNGKNNITYNTYQVRPLFQIDSVIPKLGSFKENLAKDSNLAKLSNRPWKSQ